MLAKKSIAFVAGTGFLSVFMLLRASRLMHQSVQQKLVIYNIPKQKAIDVIGGNTCRFLGTPSATDPDFYLQPSRTRYGVQPGKLSGIFINDQLIAGEHRSALVINSAIGPTPVQPKIPVDLIILSGNPKIYLYQLAQIFDCPQYVFDNSNPLWKIQYWKKDADSLHLRHHTVSEQGAFEMDL